MRLSIRADDPARDAGQVSERVVRSEVGRDPAQREGVKCLK